MSQNTFAECYLNFFLFMYTLYAFSVYKNDLLFLVYKHCLSPIIISLLSYDRLSCELLPFKDKHNYNCILYYILYNQIN